MAESKPQASKVSMLLIDGRRFNVLDEIDPEKAINFIYKEIGFTSVDELRSQILFIEFCDSAGHYIKNFQKKSIRKVKTDLPFILNNFKETEY